MGWNRLPQSAERGKSSEQDVHIITWFEILSDAGVPSEHWTACYRAAQQRKNRMMAQGQSPSIVTPNDLVVEWADVKRMHAEIDKSHLLANPDRDCLRCFGTDPNCPHDKLTAEEEMKYRAEMADKAAEMRAALKQMTSVKTMPAVESKMDLSVTYTCTACGRKAKSDFGWNYHDTCNVRLPGPVRVGETWGCRGVMEVL